MSLVDVHTREPSELQQYAGETTVESNDDGELVVVRPYGGTITLSPSLDPWERQPVERDRDWLLFKIYRDLPLDLRSFRVAYRQYAEANASIRFSAKTYDAPPHWYRSITKTHRWRIRADAFDRYMDERDIQLMSRQRLEAIKAAAHLGKAMREKALQALIRLRAVIYQEVTQVDGSTETVLVSNLSPNSIIQLAKVGVDLERAALGIGQSGRPGRPGGIPGVSINIQVQSMVSDDDLMTRASEIIEARKVVNITQPGQQGQPGNLEQPTQPETVYAEVIETAAYDGDSN